MLNQLNIPKLRFKEFISTYTTNKLGYWCSLYSGGTPTAGEPKYYDGDIPFIRSGEIDKTQTRLFLTKEGLNSSSAKMVEKGDFLIALYGANSGIPAISKIKGAINQAVLCVRSEISSFYLKLLFEKMRPILITKYLQGGQGNLSGSLIKNFKVSLPEVQEQNKIADFFLTVDNKIRLLKEKHALLEQYKKGVMQKLLSQAIRFKDEGGNDFPEWEEREFNEFIISRSEFPSSSDDAPLSSLTIKNGIEAKSARYVRDFLVTDDSNAYKLVYSEDFVANPMNLRFGAIAKNHSHLKVKISKYYDVFSCDNSVDNDFFELYLLSYEMRKQYFQTATGTLEEKKRVHFSEFIRFKKKLPSKAEQIKISAFNESLKSKISLLKQQIEQTQTFKKGLLQQMFV